MDCGMNHSVEWRGPLRVRDLGHYPPDFGPSQVSDVTLTHMLMTIHLREDPGVMHPHTFHHTSQANDQTGVLTLGAVPWLINYNVPLESISMQQGAS